MIPYFDAHCDTVSALLDEGGELYNNRWHLDLERSRKYAPRAQVFAVWGGHYDEKAVLLRSELAKNSDTAVMCRDPREIRSAGESGHIAALLSIEGAEQIECSVERLRRARADDGIVMINLCWNDDNALCGAAMGGGGGLTREGREFVRAAQGLGVAVDMSHASERTFWDVLEIADKPVIASHSNSRALWDHPRNLTDAQFAALVKCGGGAGLNLCPHFLSDDPDVDTCCAHIERFLALGGESAVFIGADLDGGGDASARNERRGGRGQNL